VAKGFVGLGAGAYAAIFECIRPPNSSDLDFLPMAAFFFIVVVTIPSWLFLPNKQNEKTVLDVLSPLHFKVLYSSLTLLALFIIGTSLTQLYDERHHKNEQTESSPNYLMAVIILMVWIGPIVLQVYLPQKTQVPWVEVLEDGEQDRLLDDAEQAELLSSADAITQLEHGKLKPTKEDRNSTNAVVLDSFNDDEDNDDEDEDDDENNTPRSNNGENKNLYQMLQTPSAWLMLWTATILVGGGTVETNNMGQMVESLQFPPVVTSASLALFSVAQAAGRVATGAVSESALNWSTNRCWIGNGVPRPFFLVVASLLAVVAHTILAVSEDETTFVFGITLSGLAFGCVWPMLVLIVGEIFGTAHVAANYMFYDGVTSAGGTFLLSKIVAQKVYEHHIDSHYSENSNDGVTCYGQKCFQATHTVIVLLSLTCVVTSLMLQYKTRHAYNKSSLQKRH
jgi:hypothetical protein